MQQTSIALPGNHPLRAVNGLARHIALPAEFAPQRYPSFPALERTAVMSFNQPSTLLLPATTAVKIGVTRQAAWPTWVDTKVSSIGWVSTYNTLPVGGVAQVSTDYGPFGLDRTFLGSSSGAGTGYLYTSGFNYPFDQPILALDEGCGSVPFTYVPRNANFNCIAAFDSPLGGAVIMEVEYEVWVAPGRSRASFYITGSVGSGNWYINSNTYSGANFSGGDGAWVRPVRFTLQAPTAFVPPSNVKLNCFTYQGTATFSGSPNCTAVSTTTTAATFFMPTVAAPEFRTSPIPWASTRLTAVALLGTNVTQVLNKSGTILGGRVNPTQTTIWSATYAQLASLHPAEKAWLPLEEGMYTYCPPSTDMQSFWDYTYDGYEQYPLYRLDNDAMCNVLYLTPGGADENLALTTSWAMEFRTSSALFQIAMSGIQLEAFHQAQLVLASTGFFFNNFNHLAIIKTIIAGAKKLAPAVAATVRMAHPTIRKGIKFVKRAVRGKKKKPPAPPPAVVKPKTPKVTMKPTSARASGITKRASGLDLYLASRRGK